MSLSKELHGQIQSLSSKIESITSEYPVLTQLWGEFFTGHYNRLTGQLKRGEQPAYDLDFIRDLGDFKKIPDYNPESITKLVDESEKSLSQDEFQDAVYDIVHGINWDNDSQRISAIKRILGAKPADKLSFLKSTFELLDAILGKLESDLKGASWNDNKVNLGTRWVNVNPKTKPNPEPTEKGE